MTGVHGVGRVSGSLGFFFRRQGFGVWEFGKLWVFRLKRGLDCRSFGASGSGYLSFGAVLLRQPLGIEGFLGAFGTYGFKPRSLPIVSIVVPLGGFLVGSLTKLVKPKKIGNCR